MCEFIDGQDTLGVVSGREKTDWISDRLSEMGVGVSPVYDGHALLVDHVEVKRLHDEGVIDLKAIVRELDRLYDSLSSLHRQEAA